MKTANFLQANKSLENITGTRAIIPMIENEPIEAKIMNWEGQCSSQCSDLFIYDLILNKN